MSQKNYCRPSAEPLHNADRMHARIRRTPAARRIGKINLFSPIYGKVSGAHRGLMSKVPAKHAAGTANRCTKDEAWNQQTFAPVCSLIKPTF